MGGLPFGYGDRARSRSVVHPQHLGRGQQDQVQPRRADIEGSQTRHLRKQRKKSTLSFRQWSDEFSSLVERIDKVFEVMMGLAAQMQEWDEDKFTAAAQQDYCLELEKVAVFV